MTVKPKSSNKSTYTFNCPIGITPPGERPIEAQEMTFSVSPESRLFPNPTSGEIFADLSDWAGERQVARFVRMGH